MGVLDQVRNRQSNIATGVASSVNPIAQQEGPTAPPEPTAPVEVPEGGYGAKRLRQFYLSSGQEVKPVNGFYIPASEEEKAMLDYYASRDVVEAPKE